jgi:hypothetical protein
MIWKIVAAVILPILCCAAIIAAAILFVCLAVALETSKFRTELIHESALPALAVAFAASAFPWQASGNADTNIKRTDLIYGQCMFTGSMICSAAYAAYWAATTTVKMNPNIDATAINALYYFACIFAVIGFFVWILGLVLFNVVFCLKVWRWDDD